MFQLACGGRENMRAMTKETFRIGTDVQEKQFVYQFQGEVDKNHSEAESSFDTSGEGTLYEVSGSPLCPVRNFKEYLSRLHPSLNALWQRPRENVQDKAIWFCNVPLSERTLGNMMPCLSVKYNLSKWYTNHYVRVTSTQILDDSTFEGRRHTSCWTQECRIREKLCKKAVNVKEKENFLNFIGGSWKCI